jgi:hypothetical protein
MRRHVVIVLGIALHCAGPLLAQQAVDAPTLLKGLQHRSELIATVAGRVVIGHKSLRLGQAEPLSDIALLDFARLGDRYRTELRVVVPGANWWVFEAMVGDGDKSEPIDPRLMYSSRIREGELLWTYDRSANRATFSSGAGPETPPGWQDRRLQSSIDSYVDAKFCTTLGAGLMGWIQDGTLTTTVQGVDKIEGHDCYRIYIGSTKPPGEGRGYWRVWIAPDLDFGTPRFEHVEVNGKGEAVSCQVVTARGWHRPETVGFWIPQTFQSDGFTYIGHKVFGGDKPGWTQSVCVGYITLTTAPDTVTRALPMRYPFDCAFRASGENRFEENPTTYADELRPLIPYAPPDALGTRLLTDKNVDAIFTQ